MAVLLDLQITPDPRVGTSGIRILRELTYLHISESWTTPICHTLTPYNLSAKTVMSTQTPSSRIPAVFVRFVLAFYGLKLKAGIVVREPLCLVTKTPAGE